MKHTWQITFILLIMFLVTQLIGLVVIKADIFSIEVNGTIQRNPQLSWIQPIEPKTQAEFWDIFFKGIIPAFILSIFLFFILSKFKIASVLRTWFFVVVVLAIFLSVYAFEKLAPFIINPTLALIIPLIVSLPLAFYKIFKRNLLVHNLTELMVYPGIAAVFVPILNVWTIIILLLLISAYDIYAVWHSKFMQKMAKFQINELKFFAGFFVPYLGKKERESIRLIKQRYKKKEIPENVLKRKKIKVSLAILGGGDVIFPIIAAGIFLKTFNLASALLVTAGATLALAFLFGVARKGKFYPAMPFLTTGIFAGMLVGWIISLI